MLMGMYVVQDKLAEECGPLFEAKNSAVAIRKVQDLLKGYKGSDYVLLYLGNIDHDNAKVNLFDNPLEVSFNYIDTDSVEVMK